MATSPRARAAVPWRSGVRRQGVFFFVIAVLVVGLVLVALRQWRLGLLVVGGAMGLACLLRAVLPERVCGWLAVRSRTTDVVYCGLMSVAMILTALVARS